MPQDLTTYCPRLWTELYIDCDGAVYVCCHGRPGRLGSIYDTSLAALADGARLHRLRAASLTGALSCRKGCTLLSAEEIAATPPPADGIGAPAHLRRLKIHFGEACNIACIMCGQDHRSRRGLDLERMLVNLDLSPFAVIDLQGGEPLFIPAARAFFDYATARGKPVSFLTNGTLITPPWAEKIARHGAEIHISLNAATGPTHERINHGSRWDRVIANIRRLREARDRLGSALVIKGHMTLVGPNLVEIPLFIQRFEDLGLDRIGFGFDRTVPGHLRWRPWLRQRLRRQIGCALSRVPADRVQTLRLDLLGLLPRPAAARTPAERPGP